MKTLSVPAVKTLADVLAGIGDVPLERVRAFPPLGTATEADVIRERESPERRLCELVDGILVEKAMGAKESILAMEIGRLLGNFVQTNRLGVVLGPDGMLRLSPGLVRIPDVSFIPWSQMPGRRVPDVAMLEIPADLAVEVLSPSNTTGEIRRKIRDYFQSGTRLVWVVDPKKQTARTYTAPDSSQGGRKVREPRRGRCVAWIPGVVAGVVRRIERRSTGGRLIRLFAIVSRDGGSASPLAALRRG